MKINNTLTAPLYYLNRIRRKKAVIAFFLVCFSISMTSVASAQSPQPSPQSRGAQVANPRETNLPAKSTYTLQDAVPVTQKDGGQRVVPVITGEVILWIILTVLGGTLIAILVIVLSSVLSNWILRDNSPKDQKNPYLSEALPTLIEGITIVYIVLAVLLLSILGVTSAEGTLSILAGISGYVLGKERGARSKSQKQLPSDDNET